MSIVNFSIPTQVYFGVDSLNDLGKIALNYGKKALLVTGGKSTKATGLLARVEKLLSDSKIDYVLFDKVTPNPLASTVRDGVETVKREGCDFLIGLGGGSPIDCAKSIGFCCVSPGEVTDYFPGEKYAEQGPTGCLPLIAITTTAGTGTEVNKVSVITDAETKRKVGIKSTKLYPVAAIVDPAVMVSLPPRATASTGADAFYHAMESYLSRNANEFSEIFSIRAMELAVKYLERAVKDGSDIEARTKMAWANTLAGVCLDNAGTIAIHGTAHPVGALYNATHGEILCATAPVYLKLHYGDAVEKCAVIAEILGCDTNGLTREEAAAKSGEYLDKFLEKVGMKLTLGDIGVTEDMLDALTQNALSTMKGALMNSPATMGYDEMYKLFKASL